MMPRCSLDVSLDVLVAFAAEGAEASLRLPGAARSVTYWRLGQIQGAEGMEKPMEKHGHAACWVKNWWLSSGNSMILPKITNFVKMKLE